MTHPFWEGAAFGYVAAVLTFLSLFKFIEWLSLQWSRLAEWWYQRGFRG